MQGRGRGQLSFHKAQPVTAPSTIASVTYDDPNGSWESWEPGASWNGAGGARDGQNGADDAPQPGSAAPQPSKNEAGMRWDEDSDTSLHQSSKPLPGTLITMSELDWEDTEELATELWRHPMRPRISRDPQVRPEPSGQRPRSARDRWSSEEPTRDESGLPLRPDPRQLPMPLPGPGGARPHARSEEPTARLRMSASAGLTRTGAHPRVQRGGPPQTLPAAPPPRAELVDAEPRRRTTTQPGGAHVTNAATHQAAAYDVSSTAMPADWLTGGSGASSAYAQAEQYSERMPAEAFMPLQPTTAERPRPPAAERYAPQPTAASGYGSQLPPTQRHAPPATAAGYAPQPTAAGGYNPQPVPADRHAPPPPRHAPPPASIVVPRPALTPPPPAGSLPTAELAPHSSQFQRRGGLIQTQAAGFGGGPPAQLPPAPPPRPSLPAEPVTHTQSFDASAPPAPPHVQHTPIESLRERSLTPPRLLPPPPRFQSSAHIPTIIGTPSASSAPGALRGPFTQGSMRPPPRPSGRDLNAGVLPPSHAQSQLIEQLQEQLLEAMARARVQEARAAEAEKSVEQAEEQLSAVARVHADESEQLQQQMMQLSQQLQAAEQRAARARQPDNVLHLAEVDLTPRPNKQGRANLILSGLLASSLSFGGAAYFMFYAPLQKQLAAVEQLRTQDSQAHATAVSNLQARSTAERQGLEAQNADLRKQLDAVRAEAAAAASSAEEGRHGRGRRSSAADAESPDGTPAGTRSARAIERRMRRSSRAAEQSDEDESPRARKAAPARNNGDDPLGGI